MKLISLGRSKQPLYNEYSNNVMFESMLHHVSKNLFRRIRDSPELLSLLDTAVTDHFLGPVDFRKAIGASRNVPAVKAGHLAGIPNIIDLARKMGINLNQPDDWYEKDYSKLSKMVSSPAPRLNSCKKKALEVVDLESQASVLMDAADFGDPLQPLTMICN